MEKKTLNEITKQVLESHLSNREKATYIKMLRCSKKFGEAYRYHRANEFVKKVVLPTPDGIKGKRNAIPSQGTIAGIQPVKSIGAEVRTSNSYSAATKKSPREVIQYNKCRAIDPQGKIQGKR